MREVFQACLIGLLALAGCGPDMEKSGEDQNGKNAQTEQTAGFHANLFPEDAAAYVRIRDVQKVKQELVQPQHVNDAEDVQQRVTTLLNETVARFAQSGGDLGVSGFTLLQLVASVKGLHVGVESRTGAGEGAEFSSSLVVVELSATGAFTKMQEELGSKLRRREVEETTVHVVKTSDDSTTAFFLLDPKTVVVGTEPAVEAAIRRRTQPDFQSLADSPRFQQSANEVGNDGELFAYLNVAGLRDASPQNAGFETVSHVAGSLRLDGGLMVRAYAVEGKEFPPFLVRTPRERKFLSRIPADAVFLMGHGANGGNGGKKNFVEWVMDELGPVEESRSIVSEQWEQLTRNYKREDGGIENEVFSIIADVWSAGVPVKSESALFVAPDASGRWGAAYLFDIADKNRVKSLTRGILEAGDRKNLPWKRVTHEGLEIHYLDFAELAAKEGRSVPDEVKSHVQLQVGYAEGDELFYVGTLEAIRFAHKPTGRTLDEELQFDNVDQKNAIMIAIRPGRILHRTFGVARLDDVLSRFASQIPKDSSYSVTLNFEPKRLTFRSSIPFVSLGAWIGIEMLKGGPAKLKEVVPPEAGKRDRGNEGSRE